MPDFVRLYARRRIYFCIAAAHALGIVHRDYKPELRWLAWNGCSN